MQQATAFVAINTCFSLLCKIVNQPPHFLGAGCVYNGAQPTDNSTSADPALGTCMAASLLDAAMSAPANTSLADIVASPQYLGDCPGASVAMGIAEACNATVDCSVLLPVVVAENLGGEGFKNATAEVEALCSSAAITTEEECLAAGAGRHVQQSGLAAVIQYLKHLMIPRLAYSGETAVGDMHCMQVLKL